MNVAKKTIQVFDNGGSRFGADRRQTIIKDYGPERRAGIERRGGVDRKRSQNFRGENAIERRELFR